MRLATWAAPAMFVLGSSLACNSHGDTAPALDAGLDSSVPTPVPTAAPSAAPVVAADAGPPVVPAGPPAALLSATEITFGNVDCGAAAPADQTFTIQNKGGGQLTWSVQIDNTSYFALGATRSGTLAANATATVTVKALAMPASANAGELRQATVALTTNDAIAPLAYVPIKATAHGATLALTPASASFGDVPIGTDAPEIALAFKNSGNAPAALAFTQPASTDFTVAVGGSNEMPMITVEPGATSTGVAAKFRPTSINAASTSSAMTVTGAVCGVSATTIPMSGRGAGGVVAVSPGALDYGLVNCGSTGGAQVVTVFNTGTASYTYTASLAGGAGSAYTVSPPSSTVLAGAQSTIIVTPKSIPQTSATTPNLFGDTLNITTTAAGDVPHAVALTQTASGAILSVSTTPLAFGTQTSFIASAPQSFDVLNAGNVAASVTVASSNADFAPPVGPASVAAGGQVSRAVSYTPSTFVAATGAVWLSVPGGTPLCAPLPEALAVGGTGIARAVQVAVGASSSRRGNLTLGSTTSCALVQGGRVVCWDDGALPAVVPGIRDATSIASGGEFGCATKSDGTVACWGTIGSANNGNNNSFKKVYGTTAVQLPVIANAVAVGIGHKHACALTSAGTVYCWGVNAKGQLGNGAPTNHASDSATPVQVSGITTATQLAVTTPGGCALLADGSAQCWGGVGGRLSYGTTPQAVDVGGTAVKLSGGGGSGPRSGFICATHADATVTCWGDSSHSKLGDNACVNRRCNTAAAPGVAVASVATATDLSAGGFGGCVVLADKTVQCWGRNSRAEVGTGADGEHGLATTVPGVAGATAVSMGAQGTCALIAGGSVNCWGFGSSVPATVNGF